MIARSNRAFSLAEMLAVVVIISMLAGIALPRYSQFSAHQQAEAAARRVAVDLSYARRQAMAMSEDRSIAFDLGSNTYALAQIQDPDHPAASYSVKLGEEPYRARIVSAVFGTDATLEYDGYGVPFEELVGPRLLGVGGTVVVAVGAYQKTITVDSSGKIQVN